MSDKNDPLEFEDLFWLNNLLRRAEDLIEAADKVRKHSGGGPDGLTSVVVKLQDSIPGAWMRRAHRREAFLGGCRYFYRIFDDEEPLILEVYDPIDDP